MGHERSRRGSAHEVSGVRLTPEAAVAVLRRVRQYAIFHLDPEGVISSWNEGVRAILGYDEDEWVGRHSSLIFTPEDLAQGAVERELGTAAECGAAADNRWHLRRDGARFWANGTVTAAYDEQDRVSGFVKVLQDRTEERRVEEELRESVERFGALADNIAQLAWLADPAGEILWFNRRWLEYAGATQEELFAGGWEGFVHPAHAERVVTGYRRAISAGEPWQDTYPLRSQDGRYRWFLSKARPIHDREGRVLRWVGTNTDVTALREAQTALRRAHIQLDAAVEAGGVITWTWDLATDRVRGNAALARLYDLDPTEVTDAGVGLAAFVRAVHEDDRERVVGAIREAIEHGGPFASEYRVVDTWGRTHWVTARGRVKRDEQGRPTRFPGVLMDITTQKETEALLERLNDVLNREFELLNYAVAHDLRTPLRGIDGFAQVLLEDHAAQLDEVGREHLRRIRAATVRMGRVIDALLDLARLPRLKLEPREVDLSGLAADIARRLAQATGQRPALRVEAGLTARGDPKQLRLALEKLLENAFAATRDRHYAEIEVGRTPTETGETFFVRDNGRGFDPAHSQRIFAPFQRLQPALGEEGLGVGLAVVQQVVSMHGGRVWAEGALGAGATFYFTLGEPASLTPPGRRA